MKIQLTLKDPDGVSDSLQRAIADSVSQLDGLSDLEQTLIMDTRYEKMQEAIQPWVDCGEYVTIEIDTDAGTAIVLRQ